MTDTCREHYAVLQQAAAWYARLGGDDVSELDRRRWETWLKQHEEHRKAWELVEKIGGRFASFQQPGEKNSAYKALQSGNTPLFSRRKTLLSMAVLSVGGVLGWEMFRGRGASSDTLAALMADYSTSTGESREITLTDGSRIWLNTATALNAKVTPRFRELRLLNGEVLVQPTSEAQNSTRLQTRDGQILTDNAEFSVRLLDEATCVTVYSGELVVLNKSQRCDVGAGQQLTFSAGQLNSLQVARLSSRAWTTGILVTEGMALSDVISELSRYRQGYLGCSDHVAGLRVVGTFSVKDTDRALTALASALPITIRRTLPWWVTVETRV